MFSSIRKFISRNSRKFAIGGAIVGGLVFMLKYNQYKLNEWRRQEVQQVLQRTRRNQHFESTERSCAQTIMNLAGSIKSSVLKLLDSDTVINNLKNDSCDKITAWNHLKILSVSKSVAIIYANVMFVFTLKIQLNLISANMFKNSQKTEEILEFNETVQEKYLTLCSHFMEKGIHTLTLYIKQKVEEVVNSISLTDKLSIRDLELLHWSIMSSIIADETNNPIKNLTKYMLLTTVDDDSSEPLNKIMTVTVDLLESDEAQSLMQSSVRSGFVLLIDRISKFFTQKFDNSGVAHSSDSNVKNILNGDVNTNNCSQVEPYFNLHEIKIPMAKLIPILNGQVQNLPSSHDIHSNWLQILISDEKLQTFSANIYEAFSF
ncbi:hypothetical protein PV326_013570 [Microctonus aethiopoides]|nr:hypothetical protein PV326_013570 [Microctonus aethiopoides]